MAYLWGKAFCDAKDQRFVPHSRSDQTEERKKQGKGHLQRCELYYFEQRWLRWWKDAREDECEQAVFVKAVKPILEPYIVGNVWGHVV